MQAGVFTNYVVISLDRAINKSVRIFSIEDTVVTIGIAQVQVYLM